MPHQDSSAEISVAKTAARRRARAVAALAPDAVAAPCLPSSSEVSVDTASEVLGDDSTDSDLSQSDGAHEHPNGLSPGLQQLATVLTKAGAEVVAGFLPLAAEVDLRPLFSMLHACGVSVVVPRVAAAAMTFHPYESQQTRIGAFGITEPLSNEVVPLNTCAAVLVPALACDTDGNRLGRGGGFYDRALADLPGHVWKVGCVVDANVLSAGEIPLEAHDVALDAVLTPRRLLVINPLRVGR